jgi:hypothetical protein
MKQAKLPYPQFIHAYLDSAVHIPTPPNNSTTVYINKRSILRGVGIS